MAGYRIEYDGPKPGSSVEGRFIVPVRGGTNIQCAWGYEDDDYTLDEALPQLMAAFEADVQQDEVLLA